MSGSLQLEGGQGQVGRKTTEWLEGFFQIRQFAPHLLDGLQTLVQDLSPRTAPRLGSSLAPEAEEMISTLLVLGTLCADCSRGQDQVADAQITVSVAPAEKVVRCSGMCITSVREASPFPRDLPRGPIVKGGNHFTEGL